MIIDAHQHLWTAGYAWLQDPSLTRIRRDYTVADLREVIRGGGCRPDDPHRGGPRR